MGQDHRYQCADGAGTSRLLDRFERQVDHDGELSPQERARRAGNARNAYFTRLALQSAQARRKASAAEDKARASPLGQDRPQ